MALVCLDRCVQSVLNTDYSNFEVIFVDNASVDGSYESIVASLEVIDDYFLLKIVRTKVLLKATILD